LTISLACCTVHSNKLHSRLLGGEMEHQHDELTGTGVIRFQAAADKASARFVSHFIRELSAAESADLMRVMRDALTTKVAA
jgi:hypothetical protein